MSELASVNIGRSEILNGLRSSLYKGLARSLEKDNKEGFWEIFDFVLIQINHSIDKRALYLLNELSTIPTSIYKELAKRSSPYSEQLVDRYSKAFSSYITVQLRFATNSNDDPSKVPIHNIEESLYSGYLDFVYNLFFKLVEADILKAVDIFKDLYEYEERTSYNQYYNVIQNISLLQNDEEKNEIIQSVDQQNQSVVVHFRATLALSYWVRYIYDCDQISQELVLRILSSIDKSYDYPDALIRDSVALINKRPDGFFNIDEWDNIERQDGEAYSPPQARYWVIQGLVLKLLAAKNFDIEIGMIPNDRVFLFLKDDISSFLTKIEKNFEKWKNIINCDNLTVFNIEAQIITNVFAQLSKRVKLEDQRKLAAAPLSKDLIKKFQTSIFNAWEKNSRIRLIAEHFGNANLSLTQSSDDMQFHFFNYAIGTKSLFTENSNTMHVGYQDWGALVSRQFDEAFFRKAETQKPPKEFNSILTCLDGLIQKLRDEGTEPNVIFLHNRSLTEEKFINSEKYTPSWKTAKQNLRLFNGGSYDGIPISIIYAKNFSQKVLICNFSAAFKFIFIENESFVNNKLNVSVEPVTKAIAEEQFKKDPDRFLAESDGTVDGAIVYLQTAVKIDIWSKAKIEVIDPTKYLTGKISSSLSVAEFPTLALPIE